MIKLKYKMNLNKFTKAELISKLKSKHDFKASPKQNLNEKLVNEKVPNSFYKNIINYFSDIINLMNLIWTVFTRITLIATLIKLITKYPILRKFLNWIRKIIFLSSATAFINVFGILDFFIELWYQIILMSTMTLDFILHLYTELINWIWGIEKTEEEAPEPEENFYLENSKTQIGNENYLSKSKPIEIKSDDDSDWNRRKQLIIYTLAITVIGCFIWVYWDNIAGWWGGTSPDPGSGNDSNEDIIYTTERFEKRIEDRVSKRISEQNPDFTKVPAHILDNPKIDEIINNKDLRTPETIREAFKEAYKEKGRKVVEIDHEVIFIEKGSSDIEISDVTTSSSSKPNINIIDPTSSKIITESSETKIGRTGGTDPLDRIKSTFIGTKESGFSNVSSENKTSLNISNVELPKVESSGETSPIEAYEYDSSSSHTSDETITPTTFLKESSTSSINSASNLESLNVNWKHFTEGDIKTNINYIEKNFPKDFFSDNFNYVKTLINDIKHKNDLFFEENKLYEKTEDKFPKQLIWRNTDKWVNEKLNKISEFEK